MSADDRSDGPMPLEQRYRNAFETVRELVRTGRATTTEALLCGAIAGLHAERSDLGAEILRLRAENERLTAQHFVALSKLDDENSRLRSQLAAATRERETPPTEPLHNVTPNPNDVL